MVDKLLLPCPFCGSTDLRIDTLYFDDDGEHDGVECMAEGCDALNRLEHWNRRPTVSRPDFLSQALNEGDGVYRP